MNTTNTCASCQHWTQPYADEPHGECHYYPPQHINPKNNHAIWPITTPTDHCRLFTINHKSYGCDYLLKHLPKPPGGSPTLR